MKSKKIRMVTAIVAALSLVNTTVSINFPSIGIVAEAATVGTYKDFTYEINGSYATITKYGGLDENVEIPSTVNVGSTSYRVNTIGKGAFQYCKSIKSVQIPSTITNIMDNAFYSCSNLESIKIPYSVTTIGSNAFYYCTNLKSVNMADGIRTIGSGAFSYCYNLPKLDLPKTVTSIGNNICNSSSVLTEINVDGNNSTYMSKDGVVYNKSMTNLVYCPQGKSGEFIVPQGVTSIGSYGFYGCSKLTSIKLPNSLNSIGEWAFYYCYSLKDIKLPDSITSIGSYGFYDCVNLKDIKFSDSLTSIGTNAFAYCTSLSGIEIPRKVTSLSQNIFYYCTNLKYIVLPGELQSIDQQAFYNCTSLKKIEIPNSVTSIGTNAFYNCTSLENVIYPYRNNSTGFVSPEGYSGFYTIYLNSSDGYKETQLVKNGGYKLDTERENCMYNLYVDNKWNSNVTATANTAYTLERRYISDNDYVINKTDGYGGYSSNVSVKAKALNAEVSFDNVNYLDKIEITKEEAKDKTLYIKYSNGAVSKGKVKLNNLNIDNTVPTIDVTGDTETLCRNTELKIAATFGESGAIVEVSKDGGEDVVVNKDSFVADDNGVYTFTITTGSGIKAKKTIELNNIIKEGDYAYKFNDNDNTASITGYIGTDTGINLPDTVVKDNKEYKVTSIGTNAFKNCTTLTSVEIPDSVTKINNYAFNGCTNLKNVKLSNKILEIANYTFNNCTSLENIKIPSSVTRIGSYAFLNCSNLKVVKLPMDIKDIGNGAFLKCSSLERIDFENDKADMGSFIFKNCNDITNVILRNSGNIDILNNKGINFDDFYKVVLTEKDYVEVQLVRKGGNKLIFETNDIYYNLYDGENLVTDYVVNEDKKYNIVRRTVKDSDYVLSGSKGNKGWYSTDVKVTSANLGEKISEDGVSWVDSFDVKETLNEDKIIYIKNKDGVIAKGKIEKDTIKIDKVKPTIEVTGDLTTKADNVELSIAASTGDSGVDKITVSRDGGEEEEVRGNTFTATLKGEYVFTVTSGSGLTSSTTINVNNATLAMNLKDFEFELDEENNTAKIVQYNGKDEAVMLPAEIKKDNKEYKVTEIEGFAFIDCSKLEKVVIPESITNIGDGAFYGCSSLKDINLPEGLTSIGEMMFCECSSLEKITIPNKVESIGESAFRGCSNLESVEIPASVKSIGSMAFSDCNKLKTIKLPIVEMGETVFDGVDSAKNVMLENAKTGELLNNSGIKVDEYYVVTLKGDSYNEVQFVKKDGNNLIVDTEKYKVCDEEGNAITDLTIDSNKEFTLVKASEDNAKEETKDKEEVSNKDSEKEEAADKDGEKEDASDKDSEKQETSDKDSEKESSDETEVDNTESEVENSEK